MGRETYTKMKDSWYIGPITSQFPNGLYHLHCKRETGLVLVMEPVWCVWRQPIDDSGHRIDIVIAEKVFGCDCGTVAPDDVIAELNHHDIDKINRKAAIAHTKQKQTTITESSRLSE